MARRRRTTRSKTRTSTTRRRTYRRSRSVSRPPIDLGPRPVLTIAAWFGISVCVGFLAYAIMGRAMWSDETLAVIPIKLALQFAFGLFLAAAGIFMGFQFGWFEPETERTARRTRRTTTRRRPSTTRRRTYR